MTARTADIETIHSYLARELGEADSLGTATSLMDSGRLDSIATLRLVMFLEQSFGIAIEAAELTPDNFETIDSIAAFIETKRSA